MTPCVAIISNKPGYSMGAKVERGLIPDGLANFNFLRLTHAVLKAYRISRCLSGFLILLFNTMVYSRPLRGDVPAFSGGSIAMLGHFLSLWLQLYLSLCASRVQAAEQPHTLDKIKSTHTISLGVRDSSGALSFTTGNGNYDGYHVEICRLIAVDIQKQLALKSLKIRYVPLTSQNRIPLIQNGTADLDCGSTTNSAARQRDVAFANTLFVEEVRIAVKANSGIQSISDLNGKKVVSTTGTTAVQLLRQAGRGHGLQFEAVFGKDHADSFLLLESGRADAFVMDASILSGNIANSKNPSDFRIVGEPLSIEPIGIMMRRDDPAFKSAVNSAIAGLVAAGRMPTLWDKWFLQPIPPSGRVIGLPLSENTKAAWANPNDKPAEDYRAVKPAAESAEHGAGLDWQVFCKSTLTGKRVDHCFAFDQARSNDPTYLTWLLNAWKWTLAVSSLALVIALALGLTVGALRTVPGIPVTNRLLAAGVELFRNIPILVQVFIWYYVLPSFLPFLKALPSYVVVAVALGLFTAARLAEQMRAGILALPRGQIQAAQALGLSTFQSYRYVIMPVALRIIIPPLTSESMNIVKNSAIAFVVSVPELTMFAMQAQEETSRGVEIYAAVTCVYALTALSINRALGWIERHTQIPGPSSGKSATQGAV